MQIILKFFVRLIMLAAAIVLALSLLVMVVVVLALWCVRAVWCKLTGKPINPFSAAMGAAMQSRMNPRKSFDRAFESGTQKPARMRTEDVTDVEAKDIR
jgi:hypothetical protein